MACKKVLYEELLPLEFIERVNAFPVAYLPLGILEWHGLHLPLGADGLQSKGVFEKIASEIGGIVLPMLFLGPDIVVNKDGVCYYGMDHHSFDDGMPQQLEGLK
ncbi:creatinine amidohydrolase/Fe(II)-dependent formamide hydrolase-like protein [Caldicoprobacter guelmensis]|uniref:creatininase family protein n=1 Tax=Caldicoprobacter guelmensis TaxID=1170224 RepID=UPI00195E7523|nr:creatininase family protein [Caldicoprobacter guelmensis]MBM7581865.1 creatinine amidohydrolase/Fe(II)-dependent formamide hydrolase-like protein [Caldicoprobacter guelmensis]